MKLPKCQWPAITPPAPHTPPAPPTRLAVRLLWMTAIWAGSILALLAVASIVRLVLRH